MSSRTGGTTFVVVAEDQQFLFGPEEVIDFTAINPDGVGSFVLGVDVTESITPDVFEPFALAMSFMSHGVATIRALPIETTNVADFDKDGDVDADDLPVWEGDFGSNELADVYGSGDSDEDGDADGHDFLTWQRQFGFGTGSLASSTTVPEPSSIALLVGLSTMTLVGRRLKLAT